jgi:hypothetical protein
LKKAKPKAKPKVKQIKKTADNVVHEFYTEQQVARMLGVRRHNAAKAIGQLAVAYHLDSIGNVKHENGAWLVSCLWFEAWRQKILKIAKEC